MKRKFNKLSKITYIYSLLVIPVIILVSRTGSDKLLTVSIIILVHSVLLVINFLNIYIRQIIGIFKKKLYTSIIDTLLALAFLALYGFLYIVGFLGTLAILLPLLA